MLTPMESPPNPVLIHVGTSAWTLGGICVLLGCVVFLAWLVLLPSMARRFGRVERMSSDEAASFAFSGTRTDYVKPEPIVHGPAVGKEWQVSLTIGDLRSAWQRKDYRYFYGYSLYCMLVTDGMGLAMFGYSLVAHVWVIMAFPAFCMLFRLIIAFMMWAAIYTKLE
jgi:hypothetical protein